MFIWGIVVVDRKISVAPMMDWTDRHCRHFHRLMSDSILLYTEMVTSAAIVLGNKHILLQNEPAEQPVALQLGGSDPEQLAAACEVANGFHYDEVNLNVGCPSDRVQSGAFGACLMAKPQLVAECIDRMRQNSAVEVTVKTRIGIDDLDSYEFLCDFIAQVSAAGCRSFTLHARKAWLQGLSPKQNREVPELDYERVYRLKRDFPQLEIIINGGVTTLDQIEQHLQFVDGVMIGRAAYQNPYLLAEIEHHLLNPDKPLLTRMQIIESFFPYMEQQLSQGVKLSTMTRHLLGLFQGCYGAKLWRRHLSQQAFREGAGIEIVQQALTLVRGSYTHVT